MRPTDAQTRLWLRNIHTPERLDDERLRDLMRAHGRGLPQGASKLDWAFEASLFLRSKIENLRPPGAVHTHDQMSYRVLVTCFVRGMTMSRAVARLGISERQLSRERSRAVALLRSELTAPADREAAEVAQPPLWEASLLEKVTRIETAVTAIAQRTQRSTRT